MRIIPKKTKVSMELFRGIGVLDLLIGFVGVTLTVFALLSDIPFNLMISGGILVLFVALLIPVDDEKAYMYLYYVMVFLARPKKFIKAAGNLSAGEQQEEAQKTQKGKAEKKTGPTVDSITPFTGIDGDYIQYGAAYSAVVVEIPSVEFKFRTAMEQNVMIDGVLGSVLRMITGTEQAMMVKIDRPVLYDDFIKSENQKIKALKEAYLNGLLNEEELTIRVGVVYDRINQLKDLNVRNKVYIPFHYMVFLSNNRQTIKGQAEDLISQMSVHNMQCHKLRGAELAIFLKYQYSLLFDEREAYDLKPEQYMDWILPDKIEFTARSVKYDDIITYNFRLTDYPMLVSNAWGCDLMNMMGTRASVIIKPIERDRAIRQIDYAIDELVEQGNKTGKTSRQIEVGNHLDTLTGVMNLLQGDNEVLFNVNTYITVYDYEQSMELLKPKETRTVIAENNSARRKTKRFMTEKGFRSSYGTLQQFESYASAMPSKFDAFFRSARGIHSGSIAAAFPYVYSTLMDEGGVCLGRSQGRPSFINFFLRNSERVNSNAVIIGKSGSGKSYATKSILSQMAAENSKIFILDPENEYTKMAGQFKGKVIDVGSATQGRLNPFHIIVNLADEEGSDEEDTVASSFNMHLQFLEEFYRQILPGIEADPLEYLNNITIRMYEEKGIDSSTDLSSLAPGDFPIFDDLYEKILNDYQLSTGEYSKTNLRILLNYISKFASGGRNSALWNGKASISTNENFIVFNFQSLLANKNNTVANAQMLLVLKWLDNEIIKNREYNMKYGEDRKIIVVIDEAHVFIDNKYPIALDFMFQLAKRIRKYNGMQIIITQNIKDFVGTEELARKSTAIINACQYSLIFSLAPNDMNDLCKLYEKAGAINEGEQNEIVNSKRGEAFAIISPQNRTSFRIETPKDIEALFTM